MYSKTLLPKSLLTVEILRLGLLYIINFLMCGRLKL